MKIYQCSHCGEKFEAETSSSLETVPCPHCRQFLVLPATELAPGTILGGFEIVRKIGEGGMGNVYLAIQQSMGRKVALKVLSKEFSTDKDIIQQFRREVQLSGRLNHPNIVRAIDAGEEGDYYYMAISYIDGEDGEKILNREKFIPEKRALEIAIKIAEILEYAWGKHNLIHRDIKPGNIMIDTKGAVYLMDLGIAQSFDIRKKDIKEEVLGSPFYMSPEQAQGLHLDWRTDLYSLGATLYHMAVGAPPYDANDVHTIVDMHIQAPFPSPKSRNPESNISKATENLLRRMLEKDPARRFSSWREFIDEAKLTLAKLSPGEAKLLKKRTLSVSQKVQSSPKRGVNPFINFGIFTALLILVILITYLYYDYKKESVAREALTKAEKYLERTNNDYESALELFKYAVSMSVGTKYYARAKQRFDEVSREVEALEEQIKYFDKKFTEANLKFNKKEYEEALAIFEEIKDISDEARRKNVMRMIEMIKQLTNSK